MEIECIPKLSKKKGEMQMASHSSASIDCTKAQTSPRDLKMDASFESKNGRKKISKVFTPEVSYLKSVICYT